MSPDVSTTGARPVCGGVTGLRGIRETGPVVHLPDRPTDPRPGPGAADGEDEGPDAASSALARARVVARGKGLRPGSRPAKRRAQDVPADRRRSDGRDFHTLSEEVDSFIAERGWGIDVAAGSVLGRWPQIVGPEVAGHCAPVSFEQGVLVVRAESTSWATQLRLLSSTLLTRLTDEAGEGVVTELRIVGPSAPSWSKGPRKVSDGRGPRDTYG